MLLINPRLVALRDPRILTAMHNQSRYSGPASQLLVLGARPTGASIAERLAQWQIDGPIGLIAAGWEEDECADEPIRAGLNVELVNSRLYELGDELFGEDPEVLRLLRERQDHLRLLREPNLEQNRHHAAICRNLLAARLTEPARTQAIDLAFQHWRESDAFYLKQVNETIREYDDAIRLSARPSVLKYQQRVLERLADCRALLLAGGHVGVLLNRLRLSRILNDFRLPVIAWSGGALALGDRVFFYHQFLPHPSEEMELARRGLGWISGVQLFPQAARRLQTANPIERALLARRVGQTCCLFDSETEIEWTGSSLQRVQALQVIRETDGLAELNP